jgi:hypothetical protein
MMPEAASKLTSQVVSIVKELGDPVKAGEVIRNFIEKLILSDGIVFPFARFDETRGLRPLQPVPIPAPEPVLIPTRELAPTPAPQPAPTPAPEQPAPTPTVDVNDLWLRVAKSLAATNLKQFEARREEIAQSKKVPVEQLSVLVKLLEATSSDVLRAGVIGEVFEPTDLTDDPFTIEDFLAAIPVVMKRYRTRDVLTGAKALASANPVLTTKSAAVAVSLAFSHRVAELAIVVAQNPAQASAATQQVLEVVKSAGAPEKAGILLRKLIEGMLGGIR